MIDLIIKELESYGVKPQSASSCVYFGKPMHIEMCDRQLRSYIAANKQVAARLWQDLMKVFQSGSSSPGDAPAAYQQIFVNAIQSLYSLASGFEKLHECGVVKTLKSVLSQDIQCIPTLVMSKTLEFHLAIEWIDFLIRQDIYIRSLIRSYQMQHRSAATVTASGPWSNVDLPMLERVWPWHDQEEETVGQERDKQKQSRYTKGLENYGTGDYSHNADAGHYWRAINLEPYSFDDDSASLYPKRELLWI